MPLTLSAPPEKIGRGFFLPGPRASSARSGQFKVSSSAFNIPLPILLLILILSLPTSVNRVAYLPCCKNPLYLYWRLLTNPLKSPLEFPRTASLLICLSSLHKDACNFRRGLAQDVP